ncbi:thermonuclease family protein [Roseofilum casamattae]|uniref:Thermonuclease family protein n=1 Tax=Roseofilum casamattae BLCC-M143 TaxID=3022442 RepID=A0ABT7BWN0_9CYAN|nr:thermonuclease family protein [Roseofilum casamattae]MDJ1182678.1 thermonuclease family protein [Roseofilum casamattae BLCC-M143]
MKIGRFILPILLAGCLSYSGCQANQTPSGTPVIVLRAIGGHSLEVLPEGGSATQTARLLGISAPSLEQEPWGKAAKEALEQQVKGKTVILEYDREKEDRYQRQLVYVWHEEQLINEEMVKQGYALAEEWFPNTRYSQRLQYAGQRARILELGIWNTDNPMGLTPQQFRRQTSPSTQKSSP